MQQKLPFSFLFASMLIIGFLFIMPMNTFTFGGHMYEYYATKIILLGNDGGKIINNWYSMGLTILIFGISIFCLFFFKKSFLLLRLCIINMILLCGLIIITLMQVYNYNANLEIDNAWETAAIFPLIVIILNWLSIRYIFKTIIKGKLNKLKKTIR